MTAYELTIAAKKWTGASVMPILLTPQGKYMQDTWDIIRMLELKHPTPPLIPLTPKKRFVSSFIEAWADEFWVPMAMHYRWNYSESIVFFKKEAGDNMLPSFVPRFVKDIAANEVAKTLISFLPVVGVRDDQKDLIHAWTVDMLGKLDAHFALHPYILGNVPSSADCALAGPLVAHLGRDPWPRDNLIPQFPHVLAWIERMKDPPPLVRTDRKDDDEIPESLRAVVQSALQEFVPMLEATAGQVSEVCKKEKFFNGVKPLPRRLEDITFPVLGKQCQKSAIPFGLWKAQRVISEIHDMTADNQHVVKEFMGSFSGNHFDRLMMLSVPRLERIDVRVKHVQD